MYIERSALMLSLDSYCCICVTLTCKREWVNTSMKDIHFQLHNERLEGLEIFALVFLCKKVKKSSILDVRMGSKYTLIVPNCSPQ